MIGVKMNRASSLLLFVFILCTFLGYFALPNTQGVENLKSSFTEEIIGSKPEGTIEQYFSKYSQGGGHVAWIVEKGGKYCVIVDGEKSPEYDSLEEEGFQFIFEGGHYAYKACQDNKYHAVVDGKIGKGYDEIETDAEYGTDISTSEGEYLNVAYRAKDGDHWHIVFNDDEGPAYDWVGDPIFSEDGSKLRYYANRNDKEYIYFNNKESPAYDYIGYSIISPDSNRLAFEARKSGKKTIVCDNREGPEYDHVEKLRFSPNSKHLAYAAYKNGKTIVIVDGQESALYDEMPGINWEEPSYNEGGELIQFSNDSNHYAYIVKRNGNCVVVIDGIEYPGHDKVPWIQFSPVGGHWAYEAHKGDEWFVCHEGKEGARYKEFPEDAEFYGKRFSLDGERFAYVAIKNDKRIIVVDGKESPSYDGISAFAFTPDSKRFAYVAEQDGKMLMVTDGIEGTSYERVFLNLDSSPSNFLSLSKPDGDCFVYGAQTGGRCYVVIDGKEGSTYSSLGKIILSPDRKRMAYQARNISVIKNGIRFIVVDEVSKPLYDDFGEPLFSPDSTCVAYKAAKNGSEFVVVNDKEGPYFEKIKKITIWCENYYITGKRNEYCDMIFSNNGKYFAYVGTKNGKEYAVINHGEGPGYDEIYFNMSKPKDDGILEYLARNGEIYYRIKQSP
jgi:Tol biopolymer transport system component